MRRDPIVEEVHRVREQMWDECGQDLDRLIESLRASEAEHRDRIICPEKLRQMRRETDATPGKPKPL
jgi:hypothetical protein